MDLVFGPVPSRRLGRSVGINNIPPKICTYSCVYCQLGRTRNFVDQRGEYYSPQDIFKAAQKRVREVGARGETIDYLTFVPDGEPTLDINLGNTVRQLRQLGPKIAVITNSSLLHIDSVRTDLVLADWVSLKVDAINERVWRKIDRPHHGLTLGSIQRGMRSFRQTFTGHLVTETMLVSGLNDQADQLRQLAHFLKELQVDTAYLSVPTRPPAEHWVRQPQYDILTEAYQILREEVDHVELLIGYEGNAFSSTGNSAMDLLSITAVHPMREDAVQAILKQNGDEWNTVHRLIEEKQLIELSFQGHRYYLRSLR